MNNKPLVTILSPCYNVEKFLPQCLDSIINQTYSNLQIVMIDDGSKDGTCNVLQEYAANDPRIEVYHQENQGVATTRNNLLDKVKGDYVLFVDSDDWIELDMVEFLVSKALKFNADVVTCKDIINAGTPSRDYSQEFFSREWFLKDFLCHTKLRGQLWNKLVKSSLLDGLRFDTTVSYGEDALLCWQFLKRTDKMIYTNKQLYHYRMVDNSLSHQSFGSKKLSAHYVWENICADVQVSLPKYLDIAKARHCIEDTLLLRDAAHCGYKEMDDMKMLQNTIKKYWHCLNKVKITSIKMKIYAFFACRSYWLASNL